MSLFDTLGLDYDKTNRKRVDEAIKDILGMSADEQCPAVWAGIKALSPQDQQDLSANVAQRLG